ncbi:hypothetical protein CAPTEDRAFT_115817 [Capitella teleta]|uniref:Amino acid permease/ SLC12A domain-containing protein n=1 Tax=Capitella teleta TaxID=283909 RepID=R7T449_CAPTE|nr:hypothetical protein CAPTEDRAFT_115817 [Capitella teleta]|eukprot:ELT87662.1 hypothetical protein CAPTEDRAFT_115817 [Capitella teleta]
MSGPVNHLNQDDTSIQVEERTLQGSILYLGMFISLFFIAGLYVMTNVAYFTVLSPLEMLQSPAVVMTFASKCFGPFAIVAPICVALTVVGSLNATMLTSSRLIFAAARDGLLPGVMSTIHVHYRTPWVALFAQVTLCVIMFNSIKCLITVHHSCGVYMHRRSHPVNRGTRICVHNRIHDPLIECSLRPIWKN